LAQWPRWARHGPVPLQSHPWADALLLGFGFVVGELSNSFLKRQPDIQPGASHHSPLGVALAIFDQADFVPAVWLTLAPLWLMTPAQSIAAFAVRVSVHFAINVIGYGIGARKT